MNSTSRSCDDRTFASMGALSEKEGVQGIISEDVLFRCLEHEISEAREHGTSLSLLLMELCGAHAVNEAGGRTRDQLVLEVIRTLQNDVGRRGLFGRTAGNEFLVVLKGCGRCDATFVGKRLQSTVSQLSQEDQFARMSLSFGVAELGVNGEDVEDLLRVATMETHMNNASLIAARTAWLSNETLAIA